MNWKPKTEEWKPEIAMTWQPIETAPKNPEGERSGPSILVWNECNHVIYHAFWSTGLDQNTLFTGWFVYDGEDALGLGYIHEQDQITHWMSVPPRPGEENVLPTQSGKSKPPKPNR